MSHTFDKSIGVNILNKLPSKKIYSDKKNDMADIFGSTQPGKGRTKGINGVVNGIMGKATQGTIPKTRHETKSKMHQMGGIINGVTLPQHLNLEQMEMYKPTDTILSGFGA